MPVRVGGILSRSKEGFCGGGIKGDSKISWISWNDVGKPKSKGGMGLGIFV